MILEISNVVKKFGGLTAINNLSLSVEEGELRCIIGPNGSGKTTLFNLITGQYRPTLGTIKFDGIDISQKKIPEITKLGICRKFQNPNVFGDLTVNDNIWMPAISENKVSSQFRKGRTQEVQERVDKVLKTIDLYEKKDWIAASLSHGEKQWLEIGMVLMKNPRIMLLDEPTAGMTSKETQKTADLIKDIHKKITCIVIEHDVDFIRELGGTVTVLNRGEFLAMGAYDEIASNQSVKDVYLGDER